MKLYFCGQCGQSLAYGDCGVGEARNRCRVCPACQTDVSLRGMPIVVVGIVVSLVSQLILNRVANMAGMGVSLVLNAIGVVQMLRQEIALRRGRP